MEPTKSLPPARLAFPRKSLCIQLKIECTAFGRTAALGGRRIFFLQQCAWPPTGSLSLLRKRLGQGLPGFKQPTNVWKFKQGDFASAEATRTEPVWRLSDRPEPSARILAMLPLTKQAPLTAQNFLPCLLPQKEGDRPPKADGGR